MKNIPIPSCDYIDGISIFGFSQQGESHMATNTPCQDQYAYEYLQREHILIVAISDGVGACELSDKGASIAVNASLDFLHREICQGLTLDGEAAGLLLRETMKTANRAVENYAKQKSQLVYSLQSTLTVAIYDGQSLYFSHAGDDGIVVQTADGKYEMATTRHKGLEAGSVYPLQSVNTWQFGMVPNVVAFIMATDGVLDGFVKGEKESNRIYYPFMGKMIYAPRDTSQDTKLTCDSWNVFLAGEEYRSRIKDDLTLISVVNTRELKRATAPDFSMDEWNKMTEFFNERRKKALNYDESSVVKNLGEEE